MSLETVGYILVFTFIGSILSLAGGIILLRTKIWQGENIVHLLAFAAGVLLATAFLDLLPEALHESGDDPNIFLAALGGLIVFFFLERILMNFHPHDRELTSEEKKKGSLTGLVVVGDGVHNFIDGFVIASSFMVSIPLGIVTSLAVAAHEIPQEISDFSILLKNGLGVSKALIFNVLSGLTALAGALLAIIFAEVLEAYLGLILAFTGGMFTYIAAATLLPELQESYLKDRRWHQAAFFLVGVGVVYLTIQFLHFE